MKKNGIGAKIYLTVLLFMMYLPIIIVVLYSFNASTARVPTVFTGFSLQWYEALFDDQRGYGEALKISLQVGLLSVLFSTLLGSLGALGQARKRIKAGIGNQLLRGGQSFLESLVVLPIMIPEIILGVAFMLLFSLLKLPSGIFTLVIAHTTFCVPYVYLLVKSRLATLGDELELAARDLGASPARAMFTITLPLIRPAVLSGALLSLAMSLDDFMISFFVSGANSTTLPLKIYSSARYGVSSQINALCTVMLLFVFLLVIISQLVLKRKRG